MALSKLIEEVTGFTPVTNYVYNLPPKSKEASKLRLWMLNKNMDSLFFRWIGKEISFNLQYLGKNLLIEIKET